MKNTKEAINKIIFNENNDNGNDNDNYNYTKELEKLLEMGFDKEKAYEAIKFSKGKMELALEYLYNGIPNNNNNNQNNSMDVNVGDDEDDDQNAEDFEDITYLLKRISSIIKVFSKEKKQNKDEILEIIQKYKFPLFQFIKENENEFNSYLASPISKEDYKTFEDFKEGKEKFGIYNLHYDIFNYDNNNFINNNLFSMKNIQKYSLGNDIIEQENDFNINNNNNNIKQNITEKDKEIINRLQELGNFSESEVIQAYFACEKNEELAANYLFEQMNSNINKINFEN